MCSALDLDWTFSTNFHLCPSDSVQYPVSPYCTAAPAAASWLAMLDIASNSGI